uniref:VWACP-3 n=1 Tax=Colubraria reticulata TaxID=604273 RepID=A0AA96V0F2_9CAEN|nr:VWACP-3 [Colubraria reticulata]
MLAILALPALLLTQLVVAHPHDDLSLRDLETLYELLAEEKRMIEEEPREMSNRVKEGFEEHCKQAPLELGLIIDSSVSINPTDYKKGLTFLAEYLDNYVISQDAVRVAAVTFGEGVYTQDGFNLTQYTSKEPLIQKVKTLPFRHGRSTDTGYALAHMRDVQLNNGITRKGVPKMVMVLTDGNSQKGAYTKAEALKVKAANITVMVVGVGNVKHSELVNIAGGVEKNVIKVTSYDKLGEEIRDKLKFASCTLVPKPTTPTTTTTTTTTTTMPAQEPCGKDFPTDINFIFSPSALGLEDTQYATRFISHVNKHEKLQEGTQYGLVTGDCPTDEGFTLKEYRKITDLDARLSYYDRNKIPELVEFAYSERFSAYNGGQDGATKVAVIFLNSAKVDTDRLITIIQQMVDDDVRVYISTRDTDTRDQWVSRLPREVTFLTPDPNSPQQHALEFVSLLCTPVVMGNNAART